ncbi:Heterogeneous nuclear ribonucleoprotein U-like protein 2 [Liparis tanakae]|uniref:Heterogeneous nuclear ribonucleoprotein U-like protein 2 n=1 Tax=Liparis tanakae TaxID=230148 RepID=A0A4Z2E625_9TELE|nr:Heterogeneous nuclear ribonucleoprotein U-like protein 2 [Liparis tanakae]
MAEAQINTFKMVLMVGLPGSGKSRWARAHVKRHPEERYTLLGTEELLACMLSDGRRPRRLQQAAQCLTEVIKVAAQSPGNYILDQVTRHFLTHHFDSDIVIYSG